MFATGALVTFSLRGRDRGTTADLLSQDERFSDLCMFAMIAVLMLTGTARGIATAIFHRDMEAYVPLMYTKRVLCV